MKNILSKTEAERLYKPFAITSVARADLQMQGFDVSEVSDETMQEIADKMAEAYMNVFWTDLDIIAHALKINKDNGNQEL